MKKITVSRHEDAIEMRSYCDPEPIMETPEVACQITYAEGMERAALAALRRTYADLQQQITGMTPLLDPILDAEDDTPV